MSRHPFGRSVRRLGTAMTASLLAVVAVGAPVAGPVVTGVAAADTACNLGAGGSIKHVIYVQFDNTHLLRDTANVPSDLEQMPNLLNFMRDNGTLLSNDHTVLISHTAGGILSSLTGVYPDRHGQTVSNSYVRTSSTGGFSFPSSFGYWTDSVSAGGTPTVPNMITPTGANAPAPWTPFTRDGCDWGGIATANTVLENANAVFVTGGPTPLRTDASIGDATIFVGSTGGFSVGMTITIGHDPGSETAVVASIVSGSVAPGPRLTLTAPLTAAHPSGTTVYGTVTTNPNGDLTKVFGEGSPQWLEGRFSQTSPAGTADRTLAQTDFVGFSIHCAQASPICASGEDDILPPTDEQPAYTGFKALHGGQQIDPILTGLPPSTAVMGLDNAPVADPFGQPGFPGFDGMSAAASLAYAAGMQEAGVPVTFAYISDAHDFHGVAGNDHQAFGPGSAGYVQQLKAYDDAFGAFFNRLASDGIDKSNTLFVFTVDEGDHFVGGSPTPAGCDGVNVPCDWTGQVGEINANIDTLVSGQFPSLASQFLGNTAPNAFTVHGDDAPTFYLAKKGAGGGQLAQSDPVARDFERKVATLTAVNPYTHATDTLMVAMADQAEMKLLHMYSQGDPNRNASFAYFADPNYFLTDFPSTTCETCINPAFAWNHGDIQPEIANTWLGFVGPGIRNLGQTGDVWTDHTDVRPTMLVDLGLSTSYENDGRAILEILDGNVVPSSLNVRRGVIQQLGAALKQLDAPFGTLGMASLKIATAGIQTGTDGSDGAYAAMDARLAGWLSQRDSLADAIAHALDRAEFHGETIGASQAHTWITQANDLVTEVEDAAP